MERDDDSVHPNTSTTNTSTTNSLQRGTLVEEEGKKNLLLFVQDGHEER
jgi:hypothetical protein